METFNGESQQVEAPIGEDTLHSGGETQGGGEKNVDSIIDGDGAGEKSEAKSSSASTEEISSLIERAVTVKAAELEKRYAPVIEENERLKDKVTELQEELAKMKAGSASGRKGSADGLQEALREREKRLEDLERKFMEERERRLAIEKEAEIERTFERSLGNKEFANERARALAKDIVARDIVYDEEKGKFVHRQGLELDEWVQLTVQDDAYQFLFRPKANRGVGASPSGDSKKPKTVFDLSFDEIVERAKRGEF